MPYTTLLSTAEVAEHLADPDWAILDVRFALNDPGRGRRDYARSHIPGGLYAHINADLSGPILQGRTGRHPLPDVAVAARRFSAWGIDGRVQVAAYDDSGGSMAARLWWLLRWLGHDAVALIDGGWPQWLREGRPTRGGPEARLPRAFVPTVRPHLLVETKDVLAELRGRRGRLFDARAAERYRGENETIDPVAGHIPGTVSAPYADNLDADGRFKSPEDLRAHFQSLLGDVPAGQSAFYCGSGVTAAHSLLALKHAGLGEARLYAGSWSEWIADPSRPIASGEK